MILDYFVHNYLTLIILLFLTVLRNSNRKENVPAAQLFTLVTVMLLAITVAETVSIMPISSAELSNSEIISVLKIRRTIKIVSNTVIYILRPFIIMIELFIIIPDRKFKALYAVPAIINTFVYSTAMFGSDIAFTIDGDLKWQGGPLSFCVYAVQLFYVLLLLIYSIIFFRRKNIKKSIIVFVIVFEAITIAILERENILTGYVNVVTALCILEYYIYLTSIYQQDMHRIIAEKEIQAAKNELAVLKNQIQPHFIYNSLGMIRSLAKRDNEKAVECIDSFSDYLRAHLRSIETDDLISFEKELENVNVYLSLVLADPSSKIETIFDLEVTDFFLPPLSLEPIIENCVNHGIGKNKGIITVKSYEDDDNIYISITDSCEKTNDKKENPDTKLYHNGIGLENTRRRLDMYCGGTLDMIIDKGGSEAKITIPKEGDHNENTDS